VQLHLIYSKGFAAMPPEVKEITLKRLHEVLTAADTSAAYAHLSAAAARRCWRFWRETLPDLPDYLKNVAERLQIRPALCGEAGHRPH